eukprot:g5206.t1
MKAQNAHPPSGPTPRKISSSSFAVAEGCELAPGDVEQLAQMIRRKYEREHGSGTGSGNPGGAEPEAEEDPLVSIHGDEAVGRCAEDSASEADKCKHWAIGIIAFVTVAALAGGLFLAFYFGLAGAGKGEPGVGLGGLLGAYGPFQEADPDGTKRRPALDYPEDRSLVHFWPLEPLGGGLLNEKFGLNDNRRFGGSEFRRGFGVRFHVGTFLEQETPSTSSKDADEQEQDQRPRAPRHDDRHQYRPAKESQLFLLDTGGASVNYLRILEGGGGELDGSGDEEYKSSTAEYLHWDDMPAAFKSEHNSNYGKLKQTLDEHQLPIVCGRYGNGDVAGIPIRDELVVVGAGSSSTTTSTTHQKSQSNSKFTHALQLPDVDIGTGGGETESASAACSSDELYRGIEMFKLLVLDGAVLRANGRTNSERVRKLKARLMQRGPPERKSRSTLYQGTGTEGQFVVQPLLDDDTCPLVSFNPFSPRNDAYRKRAGRGFQHEHEELVLGGHGAGSSGAKPKWRVAAQIVGRATGDAPVQRLGDDESLDVWLHGVWWFRTFFPFRRELLQNFRRLHEPKPSEDEKNSDESKQEKTNLFASLRLPMIAAPSPQHEIDIMQGNLGLGFLADRAESEHWPDSWPIMLDYFAMDYYAKKFQLALGKGGSAAAAVATATTWSADQDSNKVKPVFAFLLMDQATQQWLQQPLFVLHAAPKEEDVIRFPLAEELNWNRSKFSTMTALWHAYWYDRIVLHAGTETAQNKQCREWQEALRGPSYRVTGAKRKEANAKQHLAKTDRWQGRECLTYYSPLLASGGASSSRDAGAAAAWERSRERDPRRAAFHPANEGHAPVAYSPAIYAPLQKLRDQIAAYGRKIEKIEKGENLNRKRREELTDLRKQRMRLREKYAHREWQTVMTRNVVPSLRDTIGFAPTHWQLAARRIKIGTTLLEAKVEKLDYANTKAPEHKPSTMFLEQPLFWKMAEENEDDPERLVQDLPESAKYLEEYREEQKRHAEQKRRSERAKRNGNEEVREQWQKKEAEALRVRESIRKMLLPHVGRRARKQELRMNPKVFRSVAQAGEAEAPRVTPAKEARKPKLRGHGADAAAAVQETTQRECVDRDSSGYKLIFDTGWSMLSLSPELYDYFLDQIVEKDADGRRIVLRTVEKDPAADEIEFHKAERAVLRREEELRREMREEERMKLKASAAGAAAKANVAYGYESEEDDDEDGLPSDPSEDEADIRKKYRRRVPTYKYRSCLDGPDVSFELVKQNPYPEKNEYFWYNIRPRDYCYCERMEGGRVLSMHSCIAENTHIARLREPTTMPAAILGLTWHRAIGTSYDYVNREMILPKIGLEWPEN